MYLKFWKKEVKVFVKKVDEMDQKIQFKTNEFAHEEINDVKPVVDETDDIIERSDIVESANKVEKINIPKYHVSQNNGKDAENFVKRCVR